MKFSAGFSAETSAVINQAVSYSILIDFRTPKDSLFRYASLPLG